MDANKTGALIAEKRREKSMTQKELAEKLHVSNKAVSRWETGAGFPDVSLLEPLSQELGVTVTELLSGGGEARPVEELVVESTRHFSREITKNKKRYRWLLAFSAVVIIVAAVSLLYPKAQKFIPRKETTITYQPESQRESIMAEVSGVKYFYYDVARADDVSEMNFSLELWDGEGLKQTWELLGVSGFPSPESEASDPMVVMCQTDTKDFSKLDFSLYYDGGMNSVKIELPYDINGIGYESISKPEHIQTGGSVIPLQYSFALNYRMRDTQFLGQPETIDTMKGDVVLLLRVNFT